MDAQTLGYYGADALGYGDGGYSDYGTGPSAQPVETGTVTAPAGFAGGTSSPDFWAFLAAVGFLFCTRIAYEWAGKKPGQS